MARPRSEFLGSLGKLFAINKSIADAVLEMGGSDEDIAKIDGDGQLAKDVAAIICGNATAIYDDGNRIYAGEERILSAMLGDEKIEFANLTNYSRLIIHGKFLQIFRALPHDEQTVINLRFGLDGGGVYTIKELGTMLKVIPERIQVLEAQAIRNMRQSEHYGPLLLELNRNDTRFIPNTQNRENVAHAVTQPPQDVLAKPVTALGELSARTRRILDSKGIQTIGNLIDLSKKDLESFPRITLFEIQDKLRAQNLKFRD